MRIEYVRPGPGCVQRARSGRIFIVAAMSLPPVDYYCSTTKLDFNSGLASEEVFCA